MTPKPTKDKGRKNRSCIHQRPEGMCPYAEEIKMERDRTSLPEWEGR